MKEFEKLLNEFKILPKILDTYPTMMEISGFPHYENVCSNILAYFFDTSGPHRFNDLLLASLLSCAGISEVAGEHITLEVRREEITDNNKRIDILIETADFAIAVENKINAPLYNDLYEYAHHLKINYFAKTERILLVLSLERAFDGTHLSGFINITYAELISEINARIGRYMMWADSKAAIFLLDFLQTIKNLNKPDIMNPEVIDFFAKNQPIISDLFTEKKKIQNYISTKIKQLIELIPTQADNVNQWVYNRDDLVHDFTFGDVIVSVDCGFSVEGVEIVVWVREGGKRDEILRRLKLHSNAPFSELDISNNKSIVVAKKDLPLLSSVKDISEKLSGILDEIYIVSGSAQ